MNENMTVNEEIMDEENEEVVSSGNWFTTAIGVGLAMFAGGLAHKYVVSPIAGKVREKRAAKKAAEESSQNDSEKAVDEQEGMPDEERK